ncbi:MAG: cation diffusion facilitator family transporter [Clostridiales bacterium]|nr:cation diffusion facilitator family transporter [Clostridiales bacterium]
MNTDFEKEAIKVSMVSVVGNIVLSLMKFLAGIIAGSGAMISDAVHSASDVFSSIVVIAGVKIASKEEDDDHPYGHERMECVAAIVLATVLAATGLGIGYKALISLINREYVSVVPGVLALFAAIISIVSKEAMYWFTRHYAKKLDSAALMADAWHHRSDALSSVGALIGIGGAMLGFNYMEPAASLVICVFIEKAALDIFRDAVDKMVDKSCDEETQEAIRKCASEIPGVLRIDLLRTRMFGNKIYVEMEIGADESLTLKESHGIAEQVHDSIEERWPKIKHIIIHVNPVIKR